MDEFKLITKTTSIVKISSCLDKLYKKIAENRENKISINNIKELELLTINCKSEFIQLCLMSCQTFFKLVENGIIDENYVLTKLLVMLPNSSSAQQSVITESIISLLLFNLKRITTELKPDEKFECPFGLKISQHPLITVCQTDNISMFDLANKICGILNHNDVQIQTYCIEYLRPALLYIFCNPHVQSESKSIWTCLLKFTQKNVNSKILLNEIISWNKINSLSTCLNSSVLVIEAIKFYVDQNDLNESNDLIICLSHIVNQLISFGLDPTPSLDCILEALQASHETTKNYYNILLIIFAETLHIISPFYLIRVLRIIVFIAVTENCGNQYILNMILDGAIQWMSQTAFIPPDGVALAHQIIKRISYGPLNLTNSNNLIISTNDLKNTIVRNYHSDIAVAFDIAKLAESFDQSEYRSIFTFVDNINEKFIKAKSSLRRRIQLFLRALFLSKEPSIDCWFQLYQNILTIIKSNEEIAFDFLMTYFYKLSHETNPEVQLELLRGLPLFGVCKANIPMILTVIKTLATGKLSIFCMDLYLRLWKQENRTYPFLLKLLSQPNREKDKTWDYNIAKAYTIREICLESPSQFGKDLVPHLSEILNNCSDELGDLATSIALDSVVALCESNTVNITSTWKVLSGKFRHEKRPRALKSIYNLFGHVPLLQTPTPEYELLVDESLDHLWSVIAHSKSAEYIREALKAITHYQITNLLALRHIPAQFKEKVTDVDVDHIPGECWVELLQKIHPDCKSDAADLITQFIHEEINAFRSGVYRWPEDRPEPRSLQSLFSKSPLRAIVNYLIAQSRYRDRVADPFTVIAALRTISKKFARPIPPLDWCFLHSFFDLGIFEARKYCILIAKNQVYTSGTARRLLENFLVEFEPNCFEEDLLLLFSILPEFVSGISINVLKHFVEKTAVYCFKESQLSGFAEGCLFEKFLDSVRSVFTSKCDVPEILNIFITIVERYMDSIEINTRVFERYTDAVSVFDAASIDGLTSPEDRYQVPIEKLKKSTIIRCYLVLYNKQLDNPLTWLNPIIEAFIDKPTEQLFLFRHLTATFYAFHDNKNSCNWIMELFRQIQTILAEAPVNGKLDHLILLLEVLVLAIDVFSGVAILAGNLDLLATSRDFRIEIFPESNQVLCDEIFWKENEAKIYEFYHHLYKNNHVPVQYLQMFKHSIACSRNAMYFDNRSTWIKYVGMRK